ncbi:MULTISPECIES: metallophosphoesterase family protein [Paenibacillus]|uniref:metallophosphoesterase family protein n=1 Tax=Paenibacillus TaxID=44249 RepID=UPI0022B90E6C|nr:metallophosphoesterase family protein [Paenibacillus caseinilyticus]MCZ8520910.1 metallophosphoesterase family protein [Paenibacillus caseinilyticus]
MERIAVISDIHGNLPALEAVLEDIDTRGIARVICLGDLIGKGPSSDLCVDLIRERCERVVMGNWDEFMSKPSEITEVQWHQSMLGEERMSYLASLPFSAEFWMSGKYVRLFHASPRSLYERIQPWDDAARRLSLFDSSEHCQRPIPADAAGYGDIHQAYMQHLGGKLLFNAGSVGNPLDLPQASYAILEGVWESETPAPLTVQFTRVPYDVELSVRQAMESGMPYLEAYIGELRTAVYRGSSK